LRFQGSEGFKSIGEFQQIRASKFGFQQAYWTYLKDAGEFYKFDQSTVFRLKGLFG